MTAAGLARSLLSFVIVLASLSQVRPALGADKKVLGTNENPYSVPRASSPVKIDGVLDEEAWQNARVLELNYEISPRENVEPPVRTKILLTYDDSNLLIGFRCYDPKPSQIRAYLSDRDGIYNDDWVAVELDTYNDQRRTFTLFSTPRGVQTDGLGDARGVKDYSWDTIYNSAGTITDWGFSVEMGIPFSSLRFQRSAGTQIWGINAVRGYPREVSHQIWNAPYDRSNSCRVCQFVKIEGFEGVSAGHNLEINPTVTAIQTKEKEEFPLGDFSTAENKADVGVTARWGVTPNIVMSGTVNPDYSHIDADAAQLDINEPFALFYPEKRPFFNEGSDLFTTPFQAVYTRTMRDPDWGIKLTGKERSNGVGAYLVDDNVTHLIIPYSQYSRSTLIPSSNMASVFRYERDLTNNSNVGALVTNRDGEDYRNTVYGADGLFRFTRSDQVSFQFLGSTSEYPDDVAESFDQPTGEFSDEAFVLEADHFTRHFRGNFTYTDVGEDFRADLGFMPRVGYRSFGTRPSYIWIAEKQNWWTSFQLLGAFEYTTDRDGIPLNREIASSLTYKGRMHSVLTSGFRALRQRYNNTDFELQKLDLYGEVWPSRNIILRLRSSLGDSIDFHNTRKGSSIRLSPSAYFNLGAHLKLNFNQIFERMTVEKERLYTANISEVTTSYHFTSRTSIRALLQYINYDYNVSNYLLPISPKFEQFFSQLRFSYKINPRTVFYLGYTDNYFGGSEYDLTKKNYTFFAKIGYAWVL